MRHLKAGRKLGRNATHRLAMKRNLAMALFRHERIITTVEKAKEVRPFVEKLITLARKGTLHARRLVISRLGAAKQGRGQAGQRPRQGGYAHRLDQAVQRDRAALRVAARGLHPHHQAARTPSRRRRQDGLPGTAQGRRGQGPGEKDARARPGAARRDAAHADSRAGAGVACRPRAGSDHPDDAGRSDAGSGVGGAGQGAAPTDAAGRLKRKSAASGRREPAGVV